MPPFDYHEPFLLSASGSTRATAYCFSNKAVTLGDRTHVVWLDAVATVCARTYEHASQSWGPARRLFDGCDNHTSPALGADREGRLHLLYGPHGFWGNWNQGRFKHRLSSRPSRIAEWEDETDVGYCATYPSIVHTPEGLDAIAYRGGEAPCAVQFQRQTPAGRWTHARALVGVDLPPQYTHVGAWIHADRIGGRTLLWVGAHSYAAEQGSAGGVVLLRSGDLGRSWSDVSGRVLELPASFDEPAAVPHPPDGRFCGIATDPEGTEWVLSASSRPGDRSILLSRWDGVEWHTVDASVSLPEGYTSDDHSLAVDRRGGIHIVCSALPLEAVPEDGDTWGHPAHEVFHLYSADRGRSFSCAMVSTPDPSTANWLPAVSHSGPYRSFDAPVILYTHGVSGKGCSPETRTEARCVITERSPG